MGTVFEQRCPGCGEHLSWVSPFIGDPYWQCLPCDLRATWFCRSLFGLKCSSTENDGRDHDQCGWEECLAK
jgi:hypothetical protein